MKQNLNWISAFYLNETIHKTPLLFKQIPLEILLVNMQIGLKSQVKCLVKEPFK